MGLSCFSRPAVILDDNTPDAEQHSGRRTRGAERDALSAQHQQQQVLSPVRSGLSAAAAAAVAATMPALDLSSAAAAGNSCGVGRVGLYSTSTGVVHPKVALQCACTFFAVVSEPLATLSARFSRLLTPEGSPARGDGAALQQALGPPEVESSAGSFLSACSELLSDAGSWTSGEAFVGVDLLMLGTGLQRCRGTSTAVADACACLC
jgi:hypothetical protein